MPNLPVPDLPGGTTESTDTVLGVKSATDGSLVLLPLGADQAAQDANIATNAAAIAATEIVADGAVQRSGDTMTGNLDVPSLVVDGGSLIAGGLLQVVGSTTTTGLTATGDVTIDPGDEPNVYMNCGTNDVDERLYRFRVGAAYGLVLQSRTDADGNLYTFAKFGPDGIANFEGSVAVKVPAPTAANQALRWGSDALVAALNADGIEVAPATNAIVKLENTSRPDADTRTVWLDNAGQSFFIRSIDSVGGINRNFMTMNNSTGVLNMTGSSSVTVPDLTATGDVTVSSAAPSVYLYETDGSADARTLRMFVNDGTGYLRPFTDGGSGIGGMNFNMTTGAVNMSNAPTVKVPAPTADDHAATKKYVDDNSGGGDLLAANNLSDVQSASVSLSNLGGATAAQGAKADAAVEALSTVTKLNGPITQAAYDGLTPDADTLYVIVG